MTEEKFFVGIKNPLDVRRNLLECSREMIHTLQSHEKILRIREEKIKRTKQLRTVVRELSMLMAKLEEQLPKTNLRAGTVEPAKRPKTPIKTISEVDQLEDQLKDIESQISQLS